MRPKPNRGLIFLFAAVRQAYLRTKRRIRQWGGLPAKRGPAVLITNHQHVDEGETVFCRTFLRHPHIDVIAVNSRRTFETGFFAARLPWTAPLTRKLNLSGLWLRLNLLPIENHLHSRALISLAEEIRSAHGDLPLAEILPDDVLAALDLRGARLAGLWRPEFFARAQSTVKLSSLKAPYRREALENFRATVAGDIAAVLERLREGATFYYTPEGDMSHDGRLRPLRNGLTDAVLPIAEPWLCAIAYDPFRGRRLSMLYRVVQPADRDDLTTSLAAARTVTTSALLADFLCTVTAPFAAADAKREVRARLETLPNNAFVDPELRRNADAVVAESLTNLVQRGTLAAEDTLYRLTDVRADSRFPHVADMLAFQRNMLEETLAALTRLS